MVEPIYATDDTALDGPLPFGRVLDGARVVTLRRRALQSPRDVLAAIDACAGPTEAGR